jgi:hypothetical protein
MRENVMQRAMQPGMIRGGGGGGHYRMAPGGKIEHGGHRIGR